MKKFVNLFVLFLSLISGFFILFVYAEFEDFEMDETIDNLSDDSQLIIDGNDDNENSELSLITRGLDSNNESDSINVTFNLDGGYWVEDGSTADKVVEFYTDGNNMVGTTSWRTPSKAGYECNGNKCMFDGWYLDNGERWTGYVESDLTVYANWLPFEDLIVTKNNIVFTIMDRNLGATSSGTGCTNSNNSACGYYFQWGNNYGFKYNVNNTSALVNGEIKLSDKATDWQGHISTYYNGIWRTENPWIDGNFGGSNLWGWSGSLDLDIDKQGPCPYGYHIPNNHELDAVLDLFFSWNDTAAISNNLKLPLNIWSSTPNGRDMAYYLDRNSSYYRNGVRISGLAVRCFKNEKNKTIKFETNGGMELEDGMAARRWEKQAELPGAKKSGNKFLGWYFNSDFSGDPIKTNYINEDLDDDEEITLYAKWEECGDGYMESIDGTKCVSLDTLEIDAIDGGKITIMKENLGKSENLGWNERDKGPCPKGYHVPTMQDWNVLFVSWCEKHTILNDGICDVKNLSRQSYESDKDFIYVPFDSGVAEAFGEELSLVFREHSNAYDEMYMSEEYNEYYKEKCEEIETSCGLYENNSQCWAQYDYEYTYYCNEYLTDELKEIFQYGVYGGVLGAYWTSTPYIEKRFGEVRLGSSYFYINTIKGVGYFYNPLFWNTLNKEEIPVRCFKDDYVASDRMILLDLIEESDLDEYKEFEQKIRSGELELPEDKQEEIVMLMLMDGNVKNSILGFLSKIVLVIEYEFEDLNDEDKQYIQSLKSLLNEVINVTDENKSEVINHISVFDRSRWNGFNFMYDSYELQAVVEYYLGMRDRLMSNQEFEETIDDFILFLKEGVDNLFNDYDFFIESDKSGLYAAFEDLENYQSDDDIVVFLGILCDEAFDLLDKYESEIGSSRVSKLKSFFSFVYSLSEASLNITELDGFIKEVEVYLGTNDWLGDDGLIDYHEMITQEYLQEEFAKMGHRVILTSEMSADEIRDKIENIKGINFESDEYLALIGINGEEIDIDDGIKDNNRGYVKVKKKPLKEGRSSGGGGISSSLVLGDSPDSKEHENITEKDIRNQDDSQLIESDLNQNSQSDNVESVDDFGGDTNNGGMDSSLASSQGLQQQYSEEFKQAYEFAKGNGITTKSTIKEAKMDGKLTRIEMAKMLSYYAINVMGKTPDITKNVKFRDVTKKIDERYDNGVTLAYQLGIMGQNMPRNRFRPNDEVSRAEFVTALSRMLYQTSDGEYEKTSNYYIPHMAKLYNEGIVNDTNPALKERRGYVMIMLMRSVSN